MNGKCSNVILKPVEMDNYIVFDELQYPDPYGGTTTYYAIIGLSPTRSHKAIQGGVIDLFVLTGEDNVMICQYEDGEWTSPIKDEFDETYIVMSAFINKWNTVRAKNKHLYENE